MKICLIVRHSDTKAGGIGIYTRNLIRTLRDTGYKIEMSPSEKFSYLTWQFFRIPLWLVRSECDVYHAVGVIEGITLPIFKPKTKKRVTIHDLIPLKHPRKDLKGLFERFFIRLGIFSARKFDVIYAVSHLTKVDLVRLSGIPEDKIRVVYQPIDERFFREPRRKGKFREEERFMIGYISRMDYHKRHSLLVQLFRQWNNPNARLLLAGTGEEFEGVKKLAKGDPRIRLLGFIPDEDVIEFYDSLDVYIHASKYEGWGLPIVEALARGKPVIVFEDAEIPREVKNLCYILDSSKLMKLLEGDQKTFKKIVIISKKRLKKLIGGCL